MFTCRLFFVVVLFIYFFYFFFLFFFIFFFLSVLAAHCFSLIFPTVTIKPRHFFPEDRRDISTVKRNRHKVKASG